MNTFRDIFEEYEVVSERSSVYTQLDAVAEKAIADSMKKYPRDTTKVGLEAADLVGRKIALLGLDLDKALEHIRLRVYGKRWSQDLRMAKSSEFLAVMKRITDAYNASQEPEEPEYPMRGESVVSEMDTNMQHCVQRLTDKGSDTGKAFAVCTATMKKAGYYKGSSRSLTRKGQRAAKQKQQQPEHEKQVAGYNALLKNPTHEST